MGQSKFNIGLISVVGLIVLTGAGPALAQSAAGSSILKSNVPPLKPPVVERPEDKRQYSRKPPPRAPVTATPTR